MEQQPVINDHNKKEYPPMHTAEHILNATMVKMFGCPRSRNAHIERKKSKCDYLLMQEPSADEIAAIEAAVNEVIGKKLPVTVEYMTQAQAADIVDLSKLPANATDTLRIVKVGDYHKVDFKDCVQYGEIGAPSMPYYSVRLLLPQGTEASSVEVYFSDFVEVEGEYDLYPIQKFVSYSSADTLPFSKNEEVYAIKSELPKQAHTDVKTHYMHLLF